MSMSRLQQHVRALFPRSNYREPIRWEIVEEDKTTRTWVVEAATRAEAIQAVEDGLADDVTVETSVEIVSAEAVIEGEL